MNVDLIKEKLESLGFLGTANMMGITIERVLEIVEAATTTEDISEEPLNIFDSFLLKPCSH